MGQPFETYTSDRMAAYRCVSDRLCGSVRAQRSLLYGTCDIQERVVTARSRFCTSAPGGLLAIQPKYGYSGVFVPGECHNLFLFS